MNDEPAGPKLYKERKKSTAAIACMLSDPAVLNKGSDNSSISNHGVDDSNTGEVNDNPKTMTPTKARTTYRAMMMVQRISQDWLTKNMRAVMLETLTEFDNSGNHDDDIGLSKCL